MNGSINNNYINWAGGTEEEPDIIYYRLDDHGGLQQIRHDRRRGKELPSFQSQTSVVVKEWKSSLRMIADSSIPASHERFDQGHLHFWTSSAKVWIKCQSCQPRGVLYSLLVPTESDDGFEDGGNFDIDSSTELILGDTAENRCSAEHFLTHQRPRR